MPRRIPLACAVVLYVSLTARGQTPDSEKPQTTPVLPAPAWLKAIDQGKKDPRLKGYFTPEGVKLEIVADAPVVLNPMGIAFSDDGSLHCLEAAAGGDKNARDRIKRLHFNKEKGTFDRAEVVLEEEELAAFLFHDGGLYSAAGSSFRRYRQTKESGPFDDKQTIAEGFPGVPSGRTGGCAVGNDGWLYIPACDGDNTIKGSDGSKATVLQTGAIFRCRPDGSKMQMFAIGYCGRRPAIAFDVGFQLFHVDWNYDGGKPSGLRLLHAAEGSDGGWRSAIVRAVPFSIPPLLQSTFSSPAGLLIYNDTFFPPHYRGLLIYPDAQRKCVRACKVEPRGSSFKAVEELELLRSADPLFDLRQAVVGPDGAIYVLDRRAELLQADGQGKDGRIYRLTWAGTADDPAIPPRALDSWAKIRKLDDDELLKTLESENFTDRLKAQQEFVRRGEKHRPALLKLLNEIEKPVQARMAAIGALSNLWNDDVAKAFVARVSDIEPDVRRLVVEALGRHAAAKGDDVIGVLEDGDPAVRRAAALALGRTNAPGVAEILVNAMADFDGKDAILLDGLVRAIELTGKDGMERLLALTESGDMKKFNRAVETFLTLRVRAGAEALPHLLKNPHLTIQQRADLLRSYNNYLLDPPVSVEPVLEYLVKHADEAVSVKLAGLQVLALNNGLKGVAAKKWLVGLLDDNDVALLKAAIPLIGVEADGAKKAGQLLLDGKIDKALRPAVIEALKRHAGKDAEAGKLLKMIEM